MPVPRGAGMRYASTEPRWPLTLQGTVLADRVPPVASPHGNDGQLSQNVGPMGDGRHLLGARYPQAYVSVAVPKGNRGLELGPLASQGLLLHGHYLQNLIFGGSPQEEVDDLQLLGGQGKEVDLL